MNNIRKFFSNAQILSERIIGKEMTLSQAARSAKLGTGRFIPLTRHNEEISHRTADKLRAAFGSEVVTEVRYETTD